MSANAMEKGEILLSEEVDMAGRKPKTREECAASHDPWLTETVLEIKNLTVKMLQES